MSRSRHKSSPARAFVLAGVLLLFVVGILVAVGVDERAGLEHLADSDAELAAAEVSTTTTTRPPGSPFSVVWVGDMMIGSTTPTSELPPNDGANVFDDVADLLEADLVTGNLEGPLTDAGPDGKCGADSSNCYMFTQPPRYAEHYKAAGFEIVNLANNHAKDRGDTGREQTQASLDSVGILHTGFGPDHVARTEVNGNRIAAIGFYRTTNPLTDLDEVRRQVEAAAVDSEVVLAFFHGGLEGEKGVRTEQDFIDFAHAAVDAGADAVLGSGPHVLRGIEFYNGRIIAYSLGNFATYGKFSLKGMKGESAVLSFAVAPDGAFESGKLSPVVLAGEGVPEPGGSGVETVRRLSEQDFDDAAAVIDSDGTISVPTPSA